MADAEGTPSVTIPLTATRYAVLLDALDGLIKDQRELLDGSDTPPDSPDAIATHVDINTAFELRHAIVLAARGLGDSE